MTAATDRLIATGLAFVAGAPPRTETGVLLVYAGGCNAFQVVARDRGFVSWHPELGEGIDPIDPTEIVCWMRQPHPAFWPSTEEQPTVAEDDLFQSPERSVFEDLV